jgi:GPH family glycoside/pentoside/hexuronide:cation symporter
LSATDQPSAAPRLPFYNVLSFASLGIPTATAALVMGVFLNRYYAAHTALGLAAGGVFTIVRVIDVFVDPFLALAIDRTKTAIGRYRPWLLLAAPILVIGVWRLFMPPQGISALYLGGWLLVLALGTSMFSLSQAAWAANLVTGYADRARVYGWLQAVAVVSLVVVLLLGVITHGRVNLAQESGLAWIGWVLMIAIPVVFVIGGFLTPDRGGSAPVVGQPKFKATDYLKAIGRPDMLRIILADLVLTLGPGMTGPIYLFFFHDAKHFSFTITASLLIFYIGAGIFGSPFWARVSRSVGKHRMVQIACVAYGGTQTILMVIPAGLFLPTAVFMFAVGFCASAFLIGIRAMVADICDVVRLEQGQDQTTLLYSMVTTTTKIGGSITNGIAYGILFLVGYQPAETAHNTPQAIFGLEMVYLFAPIILVFVGGAMLFGYKLDEKRHAEVRDALMARDFGAAEESLVGEPIAEQT